MLIIMNKLQLVKTLRGIAATQDCHLTLKAAAKIANWIQEGSAYDLASYLKWQEEQQTKALIRRVIKPARSYSPEEMGEISG